MVCRGIEVMGSDITLIDYLIYPTTCFYYFYAIIFFFFFLYIAFQLFNRDKEQFVNPDFLSCAAISSTVVMFIAAIGTLVVSTNGSIPLVQDDILLYIVGFWIIISGVWWFKPN